MKFVEITFHWCCTSLYFSIQPTHMPARDGRPGTRAVGRWSQRSSGFSRTCSAE